MREKALAALGIPADHILPLDAAFRVLATVALPDEMAEFRELAAFYVQKKERFAEGSTPFLPTPRGRAMNRLLKVLLGLDADESRSRFVAHGEGAVLAAAGLYPVVVDLDDWRNSRIAQVHKGDPFTGGTIGAIGGNADAEDKGNPLATLLRESEQELKWMLEPEQLIDIGMYQGWRVGDGRFEAFSLWCQAYVLPVGDDELAAIGHRAFTRTVKRGDEELEVVGLEGFTPTDILQHMRSGRINFPENWKVLTSILSTLPHLADAYDMLAYPVEHPSIPWGVAQAMGRKRYDTLVAGGEGWHTRLELEDFE